MGMIKTLLRIKGYRPSSKTALIIYVSGKAKECLHFLIKKGEMPKVSVVFVFLSLPIAVLTSIGFVSSIFSRMLSVLEVLVVWQLK
jgi:hypothetical protein